MENILCLTIPIDLLKGREIIYPNYFNYSILDIRISSKGNIYCLSSLFFNFQENGEQGQVGTNIISVFDSNHKLIIQAAMDKLKLVVDKAEKDGKMEYSGDNIHHMTLLNDDRVAIFSEKNRTFIYDEFLEKKLCEFNLVEPIFPTIKRSAEEIYKYNFVSDAVVDHEGRMFCSIREKVPNNFSFQFSVIAYAEKDYLLDKDHKPTLNYITHLGNPYLNSDEKVAAKNELISKMGLKNSEKNFPSLLDQIREKYNMNIHGPWLGSPVPLSSDRILIPVYHKGMKGGTKGCEFLFAIMSREGELIGRLENMHLFQDTPYTGWHCNIYYDALNDRILYKNSTAFYIFETSGKLLKKISLEEGDLKYLRKFRLEGITASGELFFYQPDQYALIKAEPFTDIESAEKNLLELISRFKTSMRDAKKKYNPKDYHWLNEGVVNAL